LYQNSNVKDTSDCHQTILCAHESLKFKRKKASCLPLAAMQRSPKKITSALAAFESTISQNEQHGAIESNNFLTGVSRQKLPVFQVVSKEDERNIRPKLGDAIASSSKAVKMNARLPSRTPEFGKSSSLRSLDEEVARRKQRDSQRSVSTPRDRGFDRSQSPFYRCQSPRLQRLSKMAGPIAGPSMIRKQKVESPTVSQSPSRHSAQDAWQSTTESLKKPPKQRVRETLTQPLRQTSDPNVFEVATPIKSKKRRHNRDKTMTVPLSMALELKRHEELRQKARLYDPAKYGLTGILKWEPKKKEARSVRFAAFHPPRQPRRASMGDIDSLSTTALEESKRETTVEILNAAARASSIYPNFRQHRLRAAWRIQSCWRGYQARLVFKYEKLKRRLANLEESREEDLAAVKAEVENKREDVRYELEAKWRKQAHICEKAAKLIEYLREENEKIKEKLIKREGQIQETKQQIVETRESTREALTKCDKEYAGIESLHSINRKLVRNNNSLERTIATIQDEIGEFNDRSALERKVRNNADYILDKIVRSIRNQVRDPSLVSEVTSLQEELTSTPSLDVSIVNHLHDSQDSGLSFATSFANSGHNSVGSFKSLDSSVASFKSQDLKIDFLQRAGGCSFLSESTMSSFARDDLTMCTFDSVFSTDSGASSRTQ